MKSGLDTKWGVARFLQAREYRRAATNALRYAGVSSHVWLSVLNVPSLLSQAVSDRVQNLVRSSAESYFPPGARTSGASCQFGFGISDLRYLPESDPTSDRVVNVAKLLYRCYLSSKDAFPSPVKKDEWAAIVWCEASVRSGSYPGPLFHAGWVGLIPVEMLYSLTYTISSSQLIA